MSDEARHAGGETERRGRRRWVWLLAGTLGLCAALTPVAFWLYGRVFVPLRLTDRGWMLEGGYSGPAFLWGPDMPDWLRFLFLEIRSARHMGGAHGVTEGDVAEIAERWDVRAFEVHDKGFDGAWLAHLAHEPNLDRLWVAEGRVDAEHLRALRARTSLKYLMLDRTGTTDAGMEHIATMRGLTSLQLQSTRVTDAAFEQIEKMSALQTLTITDAAVAGREFDRLASLPSLRWVGLFNCPLSDEAMEHLAALPLDTLLLQDCTITDAGLGLLAGSTSIERMNIGGTSVSEAVIDTLGSMSVLKELYVHRGQFSDEALDRLRRLRPGIRIEGH